MLIDATSRLPFSKTKTFHTKTTQLVIDKSISIISTETECPQLSDVIRQCLFLLAFVLSCVFVCIYTSIYLA